MIPPKFQVVCPPRRYSTAKNIPHYFQVVCPEKRELTGILHTAKNITQILNSSSPKNIGYQVFYRKKYPTLFSSSLSSKHGSTGILYTAKIIAHKFQIVCPQKTSAMRYSTAKITLFPSSFSSKTWVNRHTTYCKNDRTQIPSSLSPITSAANWYSTAKMSHTNSK